MERRRYLVGAILFSLCLVNTAESQSTYSTQTYPKRTYRQAGGARNKVVPAENVYQVVRLSHHSMCVDGSSLRQCSLAGKEYCESQIQEAFEKCFEEAGLRTIPVDEVKMTTNDFVSCASRKFVVDLKVYLKKDMRCRKLLANSERIGPVWKSSKTALAMSNTSATAVSPAKLYALQVERDTEQLRVFRAQFEAAPRRFCPMYEGSDRSTCLKAHLVQHEQRSSAQLLLLAAMIVDMSKLDQSQGIARDKVNLMAAENILIVLEKSQMAMFHLAKIQPVGPQEITELRRLQVADEKVLAMSVAELRQMARQLIGLGSEGRTPASLAEWERIKLNDLRDRSERLGGRLWRYPTY